MSLVLPGATSGQVTVDVPAVAGTNAITLPANSGTIITTGSNGQVIPKAALPTGSVLQVVNSVLTTGASSSTSTFADTGLSATITPTSATSKILIFVHHTGLAKNVNDTYLALQLLRNSTFLIKIEGAVGYTGNSNTNYVSGTGTTYLDSPATTSATTYKTQFASVSNSANATFGTNGASSTITLMEIAA